MEIIEELPELKSIIIKLDTQKHVFNTSKKHKNVKKIPNTRMQRNNKYMRRSHSIIVTLEKNKY